MDDLEAELARFEAEIAAVDQQASAAPAEPAKAPPPKLPPPKAPPPSSTPPKLAPPSAPPPGHEPPPKLAPPAAPPPGKLLPPIAPPPGAFNQQGGMPLPPQQQSLFGQNPMQQQQAFYGQDMPTQMLMADMAAANAAAAMEMNMSMAAAAAAAGMYGMDPSMGMASTSTAAAAAAAPLSVAQIKAQETGVKKTELAEGEKKKKGVIREAAGKRWRDPTLDEWPENDFRIFVGDMGNEVTDDTLAKAFNKYASFAKAKIVRDKRTNKSKGFGFVSFTDGNDFAKAMREMQGKYIGNRPCKLTKSSWDDRNPQFKKGGGGKKHKH